jgi:deoxyribodipyrimidine photo-lyase
MQGAIIHACLSHLLLPCRDVPLPHPLDSDFVRDQLLARAVDVNGKRHNPEGEFILYWMQSTHRIAENWALRAAVRAADKVNRPLIIHQGLDPTYPYASDRHHTFILEGARDTAHEAAQHGLHYQFALRRAREDDRRVVDRVAARAYLVITDSFPTAGVRERTHRFAERAQCRVMAIDSFCAVPSGAFTHAEYAARTIRPKIAKLLDNAIEAVADRPPRVPVSAALAASVLQDLRTSALDIEHADDHAIAEAVASCEIDHSVTRVSEKTGGLITAERLLHDFVTDRLSGYEVAHNDAGIEDGSSGLSPYLHFGQIASAEVVRQARASGAPQLSIDAFVQQATTWRDLSFNWCVRTPQFDQLSALPAWVQKTMEAHVEDERPVLYDLETLERGATHDEFWNAAQHQLRETGIIHNYARMLWGKMLILWTPDYETAREWMFYLNDKWALDGRDPCSVGNIMWCLGLWDRPWGNKQVWGGIRPMLTSRLRFKFDTAPYIARWNR